MHSEIAIDARRTRSGGFTLIELLVVVAIIAVLMSILMPSLSNARSQAQAVVCGSNLRSIGLAMLMYRDENEGYYVPAVQKNDYLGKNWGADVDTGYRWYKWLEPYTKSYAVMNCPVMNVKSPDSMVADKKGMSVPSWNPSWGQMPRGRAGWGGVCNYAYNSSNVGGSIEDKNIKKLTAIENQISKAAKPVMLQNVVMAMDGILIVSHANGAYPRSDSYELYWRNHYLHAERANTLFLDGHVSLLRYQSFYGSSGTYSAASGFVLVGNE